MRVLVVNVGSSSRKLRVLDDADEVLAAADLPAGDAASLLDAIAGLGPFDASGHRIVHGGARFAAPALVDDGVRAALEELCALAPLHQPRTLAALDAVRLGHPGRPTVACFDTAFHTTLGEPAATYAIPARWRSEYAIRRYGFHGLSHAFAARRAAELLGRSPADLRLVTCHLGAGASLAAVAGGRSVDTTMGFTPLEGLVMATRSGSVDPGLVLWLVQQAGLPVGEVADGLEHEAGLTGLAGTADMRDVVSRAGENEPGARLALEVYLHRLRAEVAAMAASMGGLDGLVFTGGVGEKAPVVRQETVAGLAFLGLALDEESNQDAAGDANLTAPGSRASTVVVQAREDVEIARGVRAVLSS